MRFNSFFSPYGSLVFVLRNICLSQGLKVFLLCFLQETFIALSFTIKNMIHFDQLLRYVWDMNASLLMHLCMSCVPAAFVEKASHLIHLIKDYYPKYTKNLKCNNKKTTQFFKKGQETLTHTSSEDTQMANKHMKRCSTSHVIREMQIKMTRYHRTSSGMAKIQNADTTKCWQRCGTTELSSIAGGYAEWYSRFGKQLAHFLLN